MKYVLLPLFLLTILVVSVNGQIVVLEENFEDQDLTQNPGWTGDLSDFTFVQENGNTLLQLDAESTPTRTQIRTTSPTSYGAWEFFFRQPAYSTQNRIYVFLTADREDLNRLDGSQVNGYAIHTGNGMLELVRVDGGNDSIILSANTDLVNNTGYQVRVERNEENEWQLLVSEGYGSEPELDSGIITDDTYTESSYFGLFFRYSSGNVSSYFMDNIIIESSEEFAATGAAVSGASSVDVTFNFQVDEASLPDSDFEINGGVGVPESVNLVDDFTVRLNYDTAIAEGDYNLTITGVQSTFGATIEPGFTIPFTFVNPFTVESANLPDNHTIDIRFSEAVDDASLSPLSNFIVNGTLQPQSATLPEAETIRLEFGESFPSGAVEVELNNIVSESGFSISDGTVLTAFFFDEAEPGDILINEFFYRVPIEWRTPEFDRPRYIELYNNSDKVINLRDWTFNNQVFAGNTNFAIEPDELVVVTRGEPVFIDRFGDRGYFEADNFPTLPLTTENEIVLRNPDGVTSDSLYYVASRWGGNGFALERRDINTPAHFRENWGESTNPLRGTPGEPNEVAPDAEPPVWETLSFLSRTEFLLVFNERIDETAAADPATYTISPATGIDQVIHDVNEVRLLLNEDLINNQVYEVTIEGISDIFGNTIDQQTRSVEYLEFSDPELQELVINEILFRRLTSDSHQFIEIYNRTDNNFNLSGWTLSDATGSATIPSGTAIAANDYILFTGHAVFASTSDKIIRIPGFRSYNTTTSDAVILRDQDEITIDSLTYQPSWAGNEPGVSLERKDPGAISIDRANWAPSIAEGGSTPVAKNSVFEIDITPPEIIFANLFHPDSVEVRFTEFVNLGQAVPKAALATNSPRFLIGGLEVDLLKYNPLQANRIILDGSGLQAGEELNLVIENFKDFQGNVNSGESQPVAQPAIPGDLVFNEIMFNPLADPHDGIPDQAEYLEIVNRRPYAISLEGMFIHDRPDENDQVTSIVPVSTTAKWIPANGYFLLYPENTTTVFSESKMAVFFDLDPVLEPQTFRFSRTTLSLPNAGRQVYLADSTRTVIDMVEYSPGWHNPNLIDTRGIALERINPDEETNNPGNWGSSTRPEGGTPLAANSIFQVPSQLPGQTGIVLEPNPFSPDGDGFEDNLYINYKFDEPDYLLRVRIYDRYGRHVRTLAESHQAGFEGSLIWDGRTDSGQSNRIGIYIVYIEAYNSAAGRNRNFRETVVIARQF